MGLLQFNLSSAQRPRTAQSIPDVTLTRPTEGSKCFPQPPGYPQASTQWAVMPTSPPYWLCREVHQDPRSFLQSCFPACSVAWGYYIPDAGLHICLCVTLKFQWTLSFRLLRSFWTAAVPSKVLIWCHLQVWWVYSIPSSRWLMKLLNSIVPSIDSQGQPQNNWPPVSIWTLKCYPLNQTAQLVFHLRLPCSPVWLQGCYGRLHQKPCLRLRLMTKLLSSHSQIQLFHHRRNEVSQGWSC